MDEGMNFIIQEVSPGTGYDKEAYAAAKRAEKERVYGMLDTVTMEYMAASAAFGEYLNKQIAMWGLSPSNVLLSLAQNKEATEVWSAEDWKKKGCYVPKGAEPIFQLKHNAKTGYTDVVRCYDASVTRKQKESRLDWSAGAQPAEGSARLMVDAKGFCMALWAFATAPNIGIKVASQKGLPNPVVNLDAKSIALPVTSSHVTAAHLSELVPYVALCDKGMDGDMARLTSHMLCSRFGIAQGEGAVDAFWSSTVAMESDDPPKTVRARLTQAANAAVDIGRHIERFVRQREHSAPAQESR